MTTKWLFIPVFPILLLCGIVTSAALAQDGNSLQSAAAVGALNVKQVPANEITVAGTIQQVPSGHTPGSPAGLHILVNRPQGALDTSVGPYVTDDVQRALSTGQSIQVIGVVQTINGHNYLLARQLVVAGRQIPIRNENGFLVHTHSRTGNRPQPSQSELNGGIR
jgi:hypothetical protein